MNFSKYAIAAALLATPLVAQAQDTLAKPHNDSRFGINGSKAFHIPEQMDGLVQQRFDWMKELGVRWDRIDLWWHVTEPKPDEFEFRRADMVFSAMERNGVQWYPILCYGAAWFEEGRNAPRNEAEYLAFADYVHETVSRYRDRATYWSVWNEPNIPTFWNIGPNPEAYARLLELSATAARRANPAAKIAAPAMAPLDRWDRKFTERLFRAGGLEHIDVFDYHYYRDTPPERHVAREIAEIRAVMARHGEVKPIWVTESGITTRTSDKEATYPLQASLIVRNHLICFAIGVERFFYFDLQNWYDDADGEWDSMLGLVEAGGEKKPSFDAYRTMVEEVDYIDIIGRCDAFGDGVEAVLMHDAESNEYKLAIWSPEEEPREVQIALAGESATIVHPYGERDILNATGGIATLIIDRHPRYVHNVDGLVYIGHAGAHLQPAMVILAENETAPLAIATHSLMENPEWKILESTHPKAIKVDADSGKVAYEGGLKNGVHDVVLAVELTHGPAGDRRTVRLERSAWVETISKFAITMHPIPRGEEIALQGTIANQGRENATGTPRVIRLTAAGEETIVELSETALSGGAALDVSPTVSSGEFVDLRESASYFLEYAGARSRPTNVYTASFGGESLPKVDGELSEWEGKPAIRLGEEEQLVRVHGGWSTDDLSARVWAHFTEDAVYIAADITDDDPMRNDKEPVSMWQGDALELYLGLGGPSARTVLDKTQDFQIGIAPDSSLGKPVVFLFHKDVILEGATVAAQKTERGYAMEAMIPIAELGFEGKLTANSLVGFDVIVDDFDDGDWAPAGNTAGRSLVWNGTSMNWIDPSNWGVAVLVKE